jgi:uncharacterized membrane protein HdeD (DUF308 family)
MSSQTDEALDLLRAVWWLLVIFGVIAIGVGVFLLADPHESLSTLTVIVGILLLIDGVLAVISSVVGRGEGRGLLALVPVLSAIAGLVLIKKPFDTLIVFALIVGVWFVVAGVARFVSAFAEPEGRAATIAVAVLDLVAGIVILSWPGLGVATFAVIVGLVLIFRGVLFIYAGITLHRVGAALTA